MLNAFYSFLKVFFFASICYLIILMVAYPIIYIPDYIFHNDLILILTKQSFIIISGLIFIFVSRSYSFYAEIKFNLSKTIAFYLVTILAVAIFCSILYLIGIADFTVFKITNVQSFFYFLIYCTIPTFFIGFGEEIIFRWFLYNRLKKFLKNFSAIILSSFIFCIGHNWNLPNLLSAFVAGCFFSLIYCYTNSIFYSISIHSAWNFGQRFFFEGMSEYTYKAQRYVLFDLKDKQMYNWSEFILWVLILFLFILYYYLRQKKE
jgi:uncharacterized protein